MRQQEFLVEKKGPEIIGIRGTTCGGWILEAKHFLTEGEEMFVWGGAREETCAEGEGEE